MEKTADKKDRRSKLLTTVVVVILCLIFVVGFIWGLNSVLAMEGTMPPEQDTHGIYNQPENNVFAVKLLTDAVSSAKDGKPKAETSHTFDVDVDALETDGSDQLTETVRFLRDDLDSELDGIYENVNSGFSEKLNISADGITAADVESTECKYFARNYVYSCNICGSESDELLDGCPECGSTNLYEKSARDEYFVKLNFRVSEETADRVYPASTQKDVETLVRTRADGTFVLDSVSSQTVSLSVSYRINRYTGELTYLVFDKSTKVNCRLIFTGEYAQLGTKNVSFVLDERTETNLTWPSLKLSADEMTIEPKKTDNLTATLTCSDPTKPVVKWSSSDENTVKIDDEGYMKAGKEPGEAVITAEFEFLGKVYKDTCVVSVKIPVESMKMSKRKLTLNAGETAGLKATVSPSDATYKTAKWYTEDASVAEVDENGTVTAVKSGTVTVYAVSDDGYFKSSCEVTVK